MSLSARELSQLKKIVALAQGLIDKAEAAPAKEKAAKKGVTSRTRRSGKELAAFRKMLKVERKRGVSVADLAKEHGVSKVYIYTLK
jgi:DNA-binding IclR family transcriptional regulator